MTLPSHAEIVVIGGGIIGCSTAYHLARDHKANVILLEQGTLTSGSTWHAAGLVGQLRSSASITRVLKYSVDLYKGLEAETGLATGWKMTGCLRLATNQDRWTEFRRLATTAKSFGMDMHLLTPQEVKAMWPLMEVGDLVGASWLPTDGQASPSDITQSLAKGARMHGAKIVENVRVTGFDIEGGRIRRVRTTLRGHRLREGGQLRRPVGAAGGRDGRHQRAAAAGQAPVYHHGNRAGACNRCADDPRSGPPHLLQGRGRRARDGRLRAEPAALDDRAMCRMSGPIQLFDDDFDHFEQHMVEAIARVPALEKVGVKQMINGPESFTPDGNFILGVAPRMQQHVRRCGLQRLRDRVGRRGRLGAGAMGR
jgi:glycine/D-amino acid oxidase-like deaminating enzyme